MTKAKRPAIVEEDFSAWKDAPVTVAVLDYLRNKIGEAHVYWASALMDDRADKDQIERLRIELKAKLELIEDFINLELRDIQDDDATGKTVKQDGRKPLTPGLRQH